MAENDEVEETSEEVEETSAESEEQEAPQEKVLKHRRIRHKPSKRHRQSISQVDTRTQHPIMDAIRILKNFKDAKFDESVEVHVKLGVDPKKPDQQVRGTFVFPHGIGGVKRVIAFAEGPMAEECREAGALEVGGPDLAKKVNDGWLDFDVVVAHPAMMRHIGRLGRVLGPRGMMPNPKAGTVTTDVAGAVREFKAGKVEFRLDEGGNIHVVAGKKSFEAENLVDNIEAFLKHLTAVRPAGVKGHFMLRASVASTMSPGIRIQLPN
jgi:large subunit ribosomal protein L1